MREDDLRAYNLSFGEVARAVSNTNLLSTGGNIKTESEKSLDLYKQLDQAVVNEDYELAAKLRDEISKREK